MEENKVYNNFICTYLSSNSFKNIQSFSSGAEALKMIKQNPDILIFNHNIATMDGVEFLKIVKTINNNIEILILAENDSLETEVESMKYGAFDFIIKDKNAFPNIIQQVNNILLKKQSINHNRRAWIVAVFILIVLLLISILIYGILYNNNLL